MEENIWFVFFSPVCLFVFSLEYAFIDLSFFVFSNFFPIDRIGPVDSLISQVSSPGHCWVMEGNSGRVSIKLPRRVFVDGVSLEHASRMLLHESTSAPRDFEVSVL